MSKGKSGLCRWTALLLVFVFTFVSSGVLMLTPQTAEAAVTVGYPQEKMTVTVEQAQLARKRISAGQEHYTAIKADGTVVAWGSKNDHGELDVPAGLNNVVAVSSGFRYNLALQADGSVVSWGLYNTVPEEAQSEVVAIEAGPQGASLAIKTDGTVIGWGDNGWGQLDIPPGLQDVVAIAQGEVHALALKANGTVVAWGNNQYGQLDVPEGLSNVVAIAAGGTRSLALKADGTVVKWGENNVSSPSAYDIPYHLNNVVAISTTLWSISALRADGTVVAWGADDDLPLDNLNNIVAIDSGSRHHSLALKADGTVVAWGYNKQCQVLKGLNLSGELSSLTIGGGTLSPAFDKDTLDYTVKAGNVSAINITATLASPNHILTINGVRHVSGVVKNVTLGEGTTPIKVCVSDGLLTRTYTLNVEKSAPHEIAQRAGKRISASGHCLAIKADGTVKAWGSDDCGQVSQQPGGLNNVVEVATGEINSLALKADGTVVMWGDKNYDVPSEIQGRTVAIEAAEVYFLALLNDGTLKRWGFVGPNIPSDLKDVVAISCNSVVHFLALKSNGTVVGVGSNNYGQLNIPEDIQGKVIAVATGHLFSLALTADGTVRAWGNNNKGQCNVPEGLSNVVAIAAGSGYSLALKADGTVVTWGNAPAVPAGLSNVVAIATGSGYSLALKADGTLVTWGSGPAVPAGLNLSNTLSGLTVSQGTLSPAFNKDTLDYTVDVGENKGIKVTATLTDPNHALFINDEPQTNGTAKGIMLKEGSNPIKISVSDGLLTRTYTVTAKTTTLVNNVEITDIDNKKSIKSVSGAQIPSKLSFNLNANVNSLSIGLDLPAVLSLKIAEIAGLYRGDGTVVSTTPGDFVISENQITINKPLTAGTYELRFILKQLIKVHIKTESFANEAGRLYEHTTEPLEIEYVDLPGLL